MILLLDKLTLLILCLLLMFYRQPQIEFFQVLGLLGTVIFTCGCTCCNVELLPLGQLSKSYRWMEVILLSWFGVMVFQFPAFAVFFPFLLYELALNRNLYLCLAASLLPFFAFRANSSLYPILVLLLSALAWILAHKTLLLDQKQKEYRRLRDTSIEHSLLLSQKNKDLMEKQDYEIRVATLKERNRIAREIHDNVGHIISRSILQSGALIAINTQNQLEEPLGSLKNTLSSAMDAIRQSVHDLHDESIDLKATISGLLEAFEDYELTFIYDIDSAVAQNIKYCFISIIKEALSNIAKHSNSTAIHIILREHPSMYQLIIMDDGTDIFVKNTSGIGLETMRERVENMSGHFSVTTEHGFQIFATVPILMHT